jgi:hypothetical protein
MGSEAIAVVGGREVPLGELLIVGMYDGASGREVRAWAAMDVCTGAPGHQGDVVQWSRSSEVTKPTSRRKKFIM